MISTRRRTFAATFVVLLLTACLSDGAILVGGDPSGLAVEDFETFALDAYMTLSSPVLGISFGEKLVGQTRTSVNFGGLSDPFDVISGSPDVPLALDAAVAQEFGVAVYPRATKTIGGLGPLGYPNVNAIGEGSLAVLYAADQDVIAFDVGNIDFDLNSIDIQFFSRSGVLLADLTVPLPSENPFVFTSTGPGIAAIVLDNTGNNTGGGLFDNFRFNPVPEPASLSLAAMGLLGLLAFGWRAGNSHTASPTISRL